MRRRLAAVAVVAVLLLSGCTPRYDTPDDRSQAFGDAVAETLSDVEPQPAELRVRGSYDGITLDARLGDLSSSDTLRFIEEALPLVGDSPLGALPIRLVLSHDDARSGVGGMEWLGYDPARSERYFSAVQLWLDVLADPGVQVEERFEVQAAFVSGSIEVFDGRDLDAYRSELVGVLEQAGYVDPSISVVAAAAQ
ncbi:hypothetical protein [Herbiconiux sp.]|uniref:hypothetical protein n=1 Tax=Herbiconiux sp. TaxID=1871186 RepID=UPI0025BC7621|nr:hypothetical protein [Herbiconiux sp.]